mgnify:FL=1
MSEVVVLLADGFEEIEGLTVVDVIRRAGISLTTVSIMKQEQVTGAHQIQVKADCLWEKTDFSDTKMVVLPGGLGGMQNLEAHEGVRELLQKFAKEQRYIGAICAAPTILGRMGLLEGKRAVCYPSMEDGLADAEVCYEGVVADGTIITGRGMGVSIDFALRLVEALRDETLADDIAEQIVYQRGL